MNSVLDTIINAIRLGVALLRAHTETAIHGPMSEAEVDAMLTMAAKSVPDAPDWKTSIVDLLKVLRIDSRLMSRRALAYELSYPSKYEGTAEQNIWLHERVRQQIARRILIAPAEPGPGAD